MGINTTINKTRNLAYAAPGDSTGLLVTESIMLLSVLGGVGSLPFLELHGLNWYWRVTLAAGFLTMLAGIWYAVRHTTPVSAAGNGSAKNWRMHLVDVVRNILQAILVLLTGGNKDSSDQQDFLVLPRFAVLTGILILLPALASSWLQQQQNQNAYLFEVYFCTPAFLVLIAGTGFYAFPILNIRPKHVPQIAGLIKSSLQVLSALLLWIYMGLSVGLSGIDWMFWSALSLAVIGGLLGIPASTAESNDQAMQTTGHPDQAATVASEG